MDRSIYRGSATEATKDGGAGVFIKYTEDEAKLSYATGKYSTNYKHISIDLTLSQR